MVVSDDLYNNRRAPGSVYTSPEARRIERKLTLPETHACNGSIEKSSCSKTGDSRNRGKTASESGRLYRRFLFSSSPAFKRFSPRHELCFDLFPSVSFHFDIIRMAVHNLRHMVVPAKVPLIF